MQVKVQVVKNFDKTSNGKHINLVQKLNLKEFGLAQKDEKELHIPRNIAKWIQFLVKVLVFLYFEKVKHGFEFSGYL